MTKTQDLTIIIHTKKTRIISILSIIDLLLSKKNCASSTRTPTPIKKILKSRSKYSKPNKKSQKLKMKT